MDRDYDETPQPTRLCTWISCAFEPIVTVLFVVFLLTLPDLLNARQKPLHIVMNDRGGVVSQRKAEIQKIAAAGGRVEIRGRVCLSSCTMYLGAPDVCVYPTTSFGFHGPSNHGRPLGSKQFEYWSKVIASFYPADLARWYMKTARYIDKGYYNLTGAQLIALGISAC